MAATLSLEPLLHALPLKSESIDVAAPAPAQADQYSLAARLQRLWQERGDFSKLSVESLKVEDGEEAGAEASLDKDLTTTDVDQAVSTAENEDDNGNKEQAKAEEEQSMTQEQLWDLKLGILQGLDLARSDITSALDLLQLLLNSLNALSPAVPEEALALPSGSISSSLLHTPLPPPAEGIHVRNTALALATKTKAIDTASDLLLNASKRLDSTTNKSQSEWTDLLRLKRSGQWRIEARPAQVPPRTGTSSTPFVPNIPIDKMARDLCIFCGIEESAYRWRQAGLVRLDSGTATSGGKEREKLNIPERLEGRRRMVVRLNIDGLFPEDSVYRPAVDTPHGEDIHSTLIQVQQELFEEEIFAELIREARDQPFGITATRNAIEIRHPDAFTLTLKMQDIEDLSNSTATGHSTSAQPVDVLPHLLLVVARMQMIQLYRLRRHQRSITAGDKGNTVQPVNITATIRRLVLYYRHAYTLKQLLSSCRSALLASGVFGSDLSLDFASCLSSPQAILSSLSSNKLDLEGSACLSMASQSLNLTFSGASSITVHLPTRNLPIRNVEDFCTILKRILKAAVLKQLETTLKAVLADVADPSTWEVIPTPKAVGKGTPAFARKMVTVPAGTSEAEAFVSVLPSVNITRSRRYESLVTLEVSVARQNGLVARKTFQSTADEDANLERWLREKLQRL